MEQDFTKKGNNASLGIELDQPIQKSKKGVDVPVDNYYKDVLKQPAVVKEKLLNNQL